MSGEDFELGARYPDWGWCRICKREVPILTEDQYASYSEVLKNIKINRLKDPEAQESPEQQLLKAYQSLTGERLSVPDDQLNSVVFHLFKHTTKHIGEPCSNCGKSARSLRASYCAECGYQPASGTFVQDTAN